MGILAELAAATIPGLSARQDVGLSFQQWLDLFTFEGHQYGLTQTYGSSKDGEFGADYTGLIQGAYKRNGVVFACMLARQMLFSEARFQYRERNSGRPGRLYGNNDLAVLDAPWPNGTTGDLLSRMIQDADLAGSGYYVNRWMDQARTRREGRIRRLRPDWTGIVIGSYNDPGVTASDIEGEILGYAYKPGGPGSGRDPVFFVPSEVAHYAPVPDPDAWYRGMSWLTPVMREIAGDSAATSHKLKFFQQGATPNMVVAFDPAVTKELFDIWKKEFEKQVGGLANAYRTLYIGGGADAKVVGSDLRQIDFKATQGAGETRIAAAAGVPPVIVGLSEGLQAATYSNYSQARRRYADGTMRPLWRNAAGSLAAIVPVPRGSELWYDDRDIPFLQEDQKDAAEINKLMADTMARLIDAGFDPQTVVRAVIAGDFAGLTHSGLYSVQLQPPNPDGTTPTPDAGRALADILKPYLGDNHRAMERTEG